MKWNKKYYETKQVNPIFVIDRDTTVTTKRLTDEIAIDYGADGKIAGLEMLNASKHVFPRQKDLSVRIEGSLKVVA